MARTRWPAPLLALAGLALAIAYTAARAASPAACTPEAGLPAVCGVQAAEDVVALPGTRWLVTSGLRTAAPGGLTLVHRDDGRVIRVPPAATGSSRDCPSPPDAGRASLDGLVLREGAGDRHRLYAANHGDRLAVEVYDVQATHGVPRVAWTGCIPLPPDVLPNALATLPGGGLLVASFHDPRDAASAWRALARGESTGSLWRWTPAQGLQRVETGPLAGANGIAATADGRTAWISEWAGRAIVELDLRTGARRRLPLDFLPDNLRLGQDGQLLVAGQRGRVAEIGACSGPACPTPWIVARVDPARGTVTPLLSRPGTTRVSYACGALELDGVLYVTVRSDGRLLRVPLASLPSLR